MINPRELRIGNWVRFIPDGIEFIVSDINCFKYKKSDTINGLQTQDIEPIPLTEEWLVRLGFEKTRDCTYGNKVIGVFFYDGELNYDRARLKYVHQLQNLYFALTGEELTIK